MRGVAKAKVTHGSLLPRWLKRDPRDVFAFVDLGSHKIACVIATMRNQRPGLHSQSQFKVISSSVVQSAGILCGRIVNMAAAEAAIRRAVSKAEADADLTVDRVMVTAPFFGLSSERFTSYLGTELGLNSHDLYDISSAAVAHCKEQQRHLLHVFAYVNDPDDRKAVAVPKRHSRETEVISVSIPVRVDRQVRACLKKSLLETEMFIASPVAVGLAVTHAAEREQGIIVLDMGAQTTSLAVFQAGGPVLTDVIPIGGYRLTLEIARAFQIRPFEAERLKTRYASLYDGLTADSDLAVRHGGTGDPISKVALNMAVRTYLVSLFSAVNEGLKEAGYGHGLLSVVLCGGGSLFPGLGDLASRVFEAEARVVTPVAIPGLKSDMSMTGVVGACLYASQHQYRAEIDPSPAFQSEDSSYVSRIGQWLRTSF